MRPLITFKEALTEAIELGDEINTKQAASLLRRSARTFRELRAEDGEASPASKRVRIKKVFKTLEVIQFGIDKGLVVTDSKPRKRRFKSIEAQIKDDGYIAKRKIQNEAKDTKDGSETEQGNGAGSGE